MIHSSERLLIVFRVCFLCWFVIILQISSIETNEVELRRFLFHRRKYDPQVCPEAGLVKVYTNLILLQIESVEEKSQIVTSNIQLTCAWCDPQMAWNVTRFNISELSVSSNHLWTPDVVLVNSADAKYSRNREHYALLLRHDGYVRFMFQDLWKTICKVRSTYFPFDQQHCSLIIRSGAHDSQSIRFIQRRPIQGKSFIRGEWELVNAYTEIADERVSDFDQMNYSLVRFTLVLKRNHLYYLIKIILPFTLVSFVTLFTFLLPPQTGEKLTLNVTILLSLVIYLQLLSEFIPKSDDETPILTLFCNANFFLVSLSCIMTVFVLYLYHRPSTAHIICVPPQVKTILLDCLSPWIYCNFKGEFKDERKVRNKSVEKKPKSLGSIEKRMCQLIKNQTCEKPTNQEAMEWLKVLQHLKIHIRTEWLIPLDLNCEYEYVGELSQQNYRQRLDEWQHLALVLDRIFFLLFILAMPCTALLFVSAHLSIGNNFRYNITDLHTQKTDAKCSLP